MHSSSNRKDLKSFFLPVILFLQGAIIGIGGILPGVSGGVLCVIFGLYQPVMQTLSHPFQSLKKYWRLLLPAGLGVAAGFLGLARLTSMLMEKNSEAATCVFIGLILGMIPQLWQEAGKEGRTKPSVAALFISFAVFLAFFWFIGGGAQLHVEPNIGWYAFCGVAWGISIIVPGMSSSSILLFLGLYQPMLDGVSRLSPAVILPMAVGIAVTVFSLSRLVNYCYQKYYALASHAIIGVILATVIPILPVHFTSAAALLTNLGCIAAGVLAAVVINRVCDRFVREKSL
jgi:putative membrane protein